MPQIESKALSKLDEMGRKKKPTKDVDIKELSQPSSKTKNRVNALKNNQLKFIEAQVKYYDELQKLQSKYAQIYGDIFERRKLIVSGECEPTADECKWAPDEEAAAAERARARAQQENNNNNNKDNEDEDDKENKPNVEVTTTKKEKEEVKEEKSQREEEEDDEDEKGVSNFWLEVLQSSRRFEHLICDHDEAILSYLIDIRVRVEAEKPANSYTLEFEFADNPFFKNRVLTKTFEFKNEIDEWDPLNYHGPDLVRSSGCKIDWKPKKNVTVKLIKKKIKPRNRKSQPKIITKEEKQPSFFHFFETHKDIVHEDDVKMKEELKMREEKEKEEKKSDVAKKESNNDDDDDDDDVDSETSEDIRSRLKDTFIMMYDFSLGERLRNKIIPKAVLYMTGEAQDSDRECDGHDDDDDDDDDDDFYDDDDDDDYDDDEDDDSDDHTRRQHMAEWNREMSERVFNNPVVRRAINPNDCTQS